MQGNFKYPRIKKIHQILEKTTRFDQKAKILCVLLSHESLSTKITLHINLHILFIIYFKTSSNIQKLSKSNKYIKSYQQNKYEFLDHSFLFVIHLSLK